MKKKLANANTWTKKGFHAHALYLYRDTLHAYVFNGVCYCIWHTRHTVYMQLATKSMLCLSNKLTTCFVSIIAMYRTYRLPVKHWSPNDIRLAMAEKVRIAVSLHLNLEAKQYLFQRYKFHHKVILIKLKNQTVRFLVRWWRLGW